MKRPTRLTWQEVVLRSDDFFAFCGRVGLPGEHPGPALFTSPTPGPCGVTSGLLWQRGATSPWKYRLFDRQLVCSMCAPWQAGERLSESAGREGIDLTPEYVSQIYKLGTRAICRSKTRNQLYALWFKDEGSPDSVQRRISRQAGRLRKKGQRVEYFVVRTRRGGWWVLSTVPLWPTKTGRGRPSLLGPGVPVRADVGFAWMFGVMASGMAEHWTRSRGWTGGKKKSSGDNLQLGMAGNKIVDFAQDMLGLKLGPLSDADAKSIGAKALADARAIRERGAPCRSCAAVITAEVDAGWDAALGFICIPCLEVEIQATADRYTRELVLHPPVEQLLTDSLRVLLLGGPATELDIEHWLNDQGFPAWFSTDGELLRRSLTLVGAVCHLDGRWGLADADAETAAQ